MNVWMLICLKTAMGKTSYSTSGLVTLLIVQLSMQAYSQGNPCERCSDGTVCQTVRGIWGITIMSKGYNPVVTIPAGACNINITEAARSVNHLALKAMNGVYIFNGQWLIDDPGIYDFFGSSVVYSRNEDNCPGECIAASGPTAKELVVQLLYHDRSPGIYYSYQIPPYVHQNQENNRSQVLEASAQHQSSGYGELREPEIGSQIFNTSEPTEGVRAEQTTTPPQPTKGSLPEYSPYPSRKDIKRRGPIFSNEFMRFRPPQSEDKKPSTNRNKQALTDVTYYREINDVDYKIERQNTRHKDELSNVIDGEEVIHKLDHSNVTDRTVVSVLEKYAWKFSGFSECSRVCGGGIQENIYTCVDTVSLDEVAGSNCESAIKPETEYRVCNTEACTPEWVISSWSKCSATCGEGQMTREVTCQQRMSATVSRPLSDDFCTSEKPASVRQCFGDVCYKWRIGDWSNCSVQCGVGTRTRSVVCATEADDVVDDKYCSQSTPASEESCDMGSCNRRWYHSKWSGNCLNKCDSGIVSRVVKCLTETGQELPDSQCQLSDKPELKEPCRQGVTCGGKWFAGPWSKCSQSCGRGVKNRHIVCMKKIGDQHVITSDDNCVDDDKPLTTETCTESDCGNTWLMTDWSECSATCGGGTKTRSVLCMGHAGQVSTLCDINLRPKTSHACNTDKCWAAPSPKNKGCVNKYPNCHVVVQARLCRYWYYQRKCCASCSKNLHGINGQS